MLIFFKGMHVRPVDDADASTMFDHTARFSQATIDGVTSDPLLFLRTPSPYYPVKEVVPPRVTYIWQGQVRLEALNVESIPQYMPFVGFLDNGKYQVEIAFGPAQSGLTNPSVRVTCGRQNAATGAPSTQIAFQRFDSTVVGDPTAGYMDVSVKVTVDNTGGSVIVKLNTTEVVNITGVDTQATSRARINVLQMGGGSYNFSSVMRIRNVVLMDTLGGQWDSFLTQPRTAVFDPTAAGATEDWTRNTGTEDYDAVNDLAVAGTGGPYADGDATYLSSTSSSDKQLAECSDVSIATRIIAVSMTPLTRMYLQGMPYAFATVSKNGANEVVSSGVALPYRMNVDGLESAYGCLGAGWNFLLTGPGGVTWTDTLINSSQHGIKNLAVTS